MRCQCCLMFSNRLSIEPVVDVCCRPGSISRPSYAVRANSTSSPTCPCLLQPQCITPSPLTTFSCVQKCAVKIAKTEFAHVAPVLAALLRNPTPLPPLASSSFDQTFYPPDQYRSNKFMPAPPSAVVVPPLKPMTPVAAALPSLSSSSESFPLSIQMPSLAYRQQALPLPSLTQPFSGFLAAPPDVSDPNSMPPPLLPLYPPPPMRSVVPAPNFLQQLQIYQLQQHQHQQQRQQLQQYQQQNQELQHQLLQHHMFMSGLASPFWGAPNMLVSPPPLIPLQPTTQLAYRPT